MWGQKWGTMIWGQLAAVPTTTFVGLLLVGAVLGIVGIRALRGTRPRVVARAIFAMALLVPLAARALPTINSFSNGTVADATQVNANFTAVRTLTVAGVSMSVGATKYCGSTPAQNGAVVGGPTPGYASVKVACQAACSGSATAHMCSGEEMARSAQLGINVVSGGGWFLSGATTPGVQGDCRGFTDATSEPSLFGEIWTGLQGPLAVDCSGAHPILCCD
jgi:hypothetical protein